MEYSDRMDNSIFMLSVMYASSIPSTVWVDSFKRDDTLWRHLVLFAEVIHCMDWKDAIEDVLDLAQITQYSRADFKQHHGSRQYVCDNIAPKLTGTESSIDIINILNDKPF